MPEWLFLLPCLHLRLFESNRLVKRLKIDSQFSAICSVPGPINYLFLDWLINLCTLFSWFEKIDISFVDALGNRAWSAITYDVTVNFDNGESPEEIIRGFEEMAGCFAPDTIGMPILFLDHTWTDEDLRGIYTDLRKISERYASEMHWKEG